MGRSLGSASPTKWELFPRIYDDVYGADHSLGFFWRRYVPILLAFVLFTELPFVRRRTGLSPGFCAAALLAHALVFGGEVHLRISRFVGMRGYTSLVLTMNFLVVATLCVSPGRFVLLVWPLYFLYLAIPSFNASPSVYVALLAMASPLLAASAWARLGISSWQDGVALLGIISGLAGLAYVLLAGYARRARAERALIAQLRVKQAEDAQKLAIADDLHDTLGAALAEAALWQELGKSASGEEGRVALERAEKSLRDAMRELRAAVATLSDGRVRHEHIVDHLRTWLESRCAASGVTLELECERADGTLEGGQAHHLMKLAEEAAANALKHGAPTRLFVQLSLGPDLRLVVRDDGEGFDPRSVREGHGLSSLRRRASRLGGTLDIESRVGYGTSIVFRGIAR